MSSRDLPANGQGYFFQYLLAFPLKAANTLDFACFGVIIIGQLPFSFGQGQFSFDFFPIIDVVDFGSLGVLPIGWPVVFPIRCYRPQAFSWSAQQGLLSIDYCYVVNIASLLDRQFLSSGGVPGTANATYKADQGNSMLPSGVWVGMHCGAGCRVK